MPRHNRISQIQPNPGYSAGAAITPVNLSTDPNTVLTLSLIHI